MNKQDRIAHFEEQIKQKERQLLINAPDVVDSHEGIAVSIRALTTVLKHYVTTEYVKLARDNKDIDMNYHNAVVNGVCDAIEYITLIGENCTDLDELKEWLASEKREVNNG